MKKENTEDILSALGFGVDLICDLVIGAVRLIANIF